LHRNVLYCFAMRGSTHDLNDFLEQLARDARPGDRLPTIRELMQRFGASQVLVQRAFDALKKRGSIESQVGRGTFFVAPGSAKPAAAGTAEVARAPRETAVRSVLLLRRSISIVRGRVLVEGLQRRFAADGHRVLELSYTDPDHALHALKGLPRFDACVVQSTFKAIPIELLAALRDKCDVLAVDGTALVGTDVEAVGMEWGEPLAAALALLQQRGHRRVAYAATSHPLLATQLGWRRFEQLRSVQPGLDLLPIALPQLPDAGYVAALKQALQSMRSDGHLPFTALVVWGIDDGAAFRALLSDIGIEIPAQLSVVLLGRTDLPNEHAGFFDTVGCTVADQIEALHRAVHARWADPSLPHGVRLIPVTRRAGASVAAPGAQTAVKAKVAKARTAARG
jgi:DNA-binding LacI/PurR family transcriptional regulator